MSERTKQIKNMLKHSTTMPSGAGGTQNGQWLMGSAAQSHNHGHSHHHHHADGSCCGHDHSHDHHHDDEDDTTNPSGGCC